MGFAILSRKSIYTYSFSLTNFQISRRAEVRDQRHLRNPSRNLDVKTFVAENRRKEFSATNLQFRQSGGSHHRGRQIGDGKNDRRFSPKLAATADRRETTKAFWSRSERESDPRSVDNNGFVVKEDIQTWNTELANFNLVNKVFFRTNASIILFHPPAPSFDQHFINFCYTSRF